jgi:hypothetical protein
MIRPVKGREIDSCLLESRPGAVGRLKPRPITVDGVRDENARAHDAEKCGDCFQHGVDPKSPAAGPNGMQRCTVKGISSGAEFCKPSDVLLQQIGASRATNR